MKVVFANVSADDNRGGAAITFATATAVRTSLHASDMAMIPAAGITEVRHALRHTRHAFPDVRMLPPFFRTRRGLAFLVSVLEAIALARYFFMRPGSHAPAAISEVVGADLVVTRGDALFVDRPSLKGLLSVAAANLPALIARRWGVPSVHTGTEIGPFAHPPSQWLCALVLRRVGLIAARNAESVKAALDLGVPPASVVVLPDSAFTFPAPSPTHCARVSARVGLGDRSFALVTVGADQPVAKLDSFYAQLREILRSLLDSDVVERVAVVLQVDGRHVTDRQASAQFVSSFEDERVVMVDDDLDPHDLCALHGSATFVSGTRMHSSILALVAGTPAFPVALWPKVTKVFEPLGLRDHIVRFPDPDVQGMIKRITAVVHEGESGRARMRGIAGAQRDQWVRLPALLAQARRLY